MGQEGGAGETCDVGQEYLGFQLGNICHLAENAGGASQARAHGPRSRTFPQSSHSQPTNQLTNKPLPLQHLCLFSRGQCVNEGVQVAIQYV
jgi:hypothetical protein